MTTCKNDLASRPSDLNRDRYFFAIPPPIGRNPRQIVAFSPYIKGVPRRHYDGGHAPECKFAKRITPEDWLASNGYVSSGTTRGNGGAVFATIFVVASTTMKTMIPLRVFGILFNVVADRNRDSDP